MTPRLVLSQIDKSFGPLQVLHGVTLTVGAGEVHGLLGENGAGKSTLLNILSGVFRADAGRVEIDGQARTITSPRDASDAGIAMIHQELQQVPELTVAQNMFLGASLRHLGGLFVDRAAQEAEARRLLAPLDPLIDVTAPIRTLRVAQRQIVEIAKALRARARIIAMDEPTSSLTPKEFDRLVEVIRGLQAQGVSVIYVSHKMDEVYRVCQSATILRDGRLIGRVELPQTPVATVIERMVGRELAHGVHHGFARERVVLEARGLTRGRAVVDASLSLREGEVLCIAGLVGSGRTELLRLIAGVDAADAGEVLVDGKVIAGGDPRRRIRAGLGLLPEERKRDGIIRHRPVTTNIALPAMRRFSRFGIIRRAALTARSEELMRDVQLRPLDVARPIGSFSGGNQQKAIIGRWLAADTRIFLFDEPTRGIDVGAKAEIYALIERLAKEGRSILVVSSELPEVIRLADRVLVMREGRIAAELGPGEITEENIARHAIPAA
ncbi:sugar ABC transporter ATP-binding protein [Paragemmobacter straminiformis]|uniref:Sugar ABC transporter ATP-binding protein n=1 Tax=Paragemmobacter straminiformis TaxID=2045119 RepID=A0A842I6Q7_9RHOB|nr:sugar ABC transporter ATP-binding protein [Gemmobacter straminiformis]MBC2835057.1 sugar ABC transporter ATP-binding protein [Gemmobacter straminiformis]